MLVLIVFWVALIVGVIGWAGAVAEREGQIARPTLWMFVLAFLAAVVDGAAWL
ncbi:hypothetical protein BSP239C_03216 [Brevibacterium sp. 239c]|uniref:hypothetical protein n=1 Tax=Brevibacterium sp. 239c TaxID=1965356 RepID=UPI000C57E493|nr:hypothetical protein [Brevibacterium sp. 239c]SMY01342.1 hypothetical protein BSP239C_03216 [Brevibacterium sp. 239c]